MARIYLIDDDVDQTEINRRVLESRGHEVLVAYSAAEAQETLASMEKLPDAIVLDVMMEHQTAGFFLAKELNDSYPNIPVIILSSINEVHGKPWRFEPDETWLPVVTFLDKPVTPARLADEVDSVTASA